MRSPANNPSLGKPSLKVVELTIALNDINEEWIMKQESKLREFSMIKDERQALANILRGKRIELGLSARELARQAGIDNATITLLEQCKISHPRVETVRALAAILGVPLADIYSAMNWLPEGELPSLRPYMRAKYGELTEAELSEIERFVLVVSGRNHHGPRRGEDE